MTASRPTYLTRRHDDGRQPTVRVICFPFMGGGPSVYRSWPGRLPGNMEVVAVHLPGRGSRLGEAPFERMGPLVTMLADELEGLDDRPFVFYGHSMGALVAFELCRELRRRGRDLPLALFAGAHRAPQAAPSHERPPTAGDDELIAYIERFGGTPKEVLADREMMRLSLGAFRADAKVCASFTYAEEAPLPIPIHCFGGMEDRAVTEQDLWAWQAQTTAGFSLCRVRGGHFFLEPDASPVLRAIGASVGQLLRADVVARVGARQGRRRLQATLQDLAAAAGNTPLREIEATIDGRPRPITLKLEAGNPSGSIKYRTAIGLLTSAATQGLLTPRTTIVESTSGNLGVALALAAHHCGLRFHAVVDPNTSAERLAAMRSLGAEVDMVTRSDENGNYLAGRLARVEEVLGERADALWTNQYQNEANPDAHAAGTGREIVEQCGGDLGAVVVAVSTGGTLAGVSRCLRRRSPTATVIAVDLEGSVAVGGRPGLRRIPGIGSSRRSDFVGPGTADVVTHVTDVAACTVCRELEVSTGIGVGGSSGAVIAAAARWLRHHDVEGRVVCLCPDGADNYRSSIFDDSWLRERSLTLDAGAERIERFATPAADRSPAGGAGRG
jgi:2,3-diaminopropionate biosynthesis protein SbnA